MSVIFARVVIFTYVFIYLCLYIIHICVQTWLNLYLHLTYWNGREKQLISSLVPSSTPPAAFPSSHTLCFSGFLLDGWITKPSGWALWFCEACVPGREGEGGLAGVFVGALGLCVSWGTLAPARRPSSYMRITTVNSSNTRNTKTTHMIIHWSTALA